MKTQIYRLRSLNAPCARDLGYYARFSVIKIRQVSNREH